MKENAKHNHGEGWKNEKIVLKSCNISAVHCVHSFLVSFFNNGLWKHAMIVRGLNER